VLFGSQIRQLKFWHQPRCSVLVRVQGKQLYSYVIQIRIPGVTGAALVRLDSMSEADNYVPPTP